MVKVLLPADGATYFGIFKNGKEHGQGTLLAGITAHNILANLETENMEWGNILIQTVQPKLVNIRMDYFMAKVS